MDYVEQKGARRAMCALSDVRPGLARCSAKRLSAHVFCARITTSGLAVIPSSCSRITDGSFWGRCDLNNQPDRQPETSAPCAPRLGPGRTIPSCPRQSCPRHSCSRATLSLPDGIGPRGSFLRRASRCLHTPLAKMGCRLLRGAGEAGGACAGCLSDRASPTAARTQLQGAGNICTTPHCWDEVGSARLGMAVLTTRNTSRAQPFVARPTTNASVCASAAPCRKKSCPMRKGSQDVLTTTPARLRALADQDVGAPTAPADSSGTAVISHELPYSGLHT
jgi:hypothetical protein